jgi:hypothetical protein
MRHDCGERTAHRLVPIPHINRIASYHAGRQGKGSLTTHDEDGMAMAVDEELMAVIMPACR